MARKARVIHELTSSDRKRFFAKFRVQEEPHPELGTPCHEWTACRTKKGHGKIRLAGSTFYAHRVAKTLAGHELTTDGSLVLTHLCLNAWCVNPEHLEERTERENLSDPDGGFVVAARNKQAATHCKSGHERTPENTYTTIGRRGCLICRRAREARYRARKRARR